MSPSAATVAKSSSSATGSSVAQGGKRSSKVLIESVAAGEKPGSGDPEILDSSTSSYKSESYDSNPPNNEGDLKPAAKKPDPKDSDGSVSSEESEDTIGIFSKLPVFQG